MSDTDEEEAGPPVQLGEDADVEGAPLARVASRLHYAIEKSEVIRREGDTTIRTPEGPRDVADVLEETDEVYFDTRQAFQRTIRGIVGTGPVPTAGGKTSEDDETPPAADGDAKSGDEPSGESGDESDEEAVDADIEASGDADEEVEQAFEPVNDETAEESGFEFDEE